MASQRSRRAFTCAAVTVAVGLSGACSSAPGADVEDPGAGAAAPNAPAATMSPKPRVKRSPDASRSRSAKASAERKPSPALSFRSGPRRAQASPSTKATPGPAGRSTRGGDSNPLATASASVVDLRDDALASGEPPSYADLLRAALQGRGRTLQMTMTFAAELPERTRDEDEQFIAAIGIRDKNGETRWTFGARCSERGWKAFAKSRNKSRPFPGRFRIDGTTVRLTIPWSAVNGPHRFEWIASGSWVRTVQNIPSYSIDPAPNGGNARFPN